MADRERFERNELWRGCRHRREGGRIELPGDGGALALPALCDLKLGSLALAERKGLTVGLCRTSQCPFVDEGDVP